MRLVLDYFPNADHAGLYAAQAAGEFERAGLDVEIKAPPDPAAPLKLLQAGRADLVLSYEPELLLARDKGADDLVAVGALVQKPLTSLMALPGSGIRGARDLAGKRVGTAGIAYQSAYLKTILEKAGVDPGSVKETNVGFDFSRPLIAEPRRRHARRLLELRGRRPPAPRQEARDPARWTSSACRPTTSWSSSPAGRTSTRRARRGSAASSRPPRAGTGSSGDDPDAGDRRAAGGLQGPRPRPPGRGREGDAAGVLPRGRGPAPSAGRIPPKWDAYGRWMQENGLLKQPPNAGAGADQRVPAGRGAGPGRLRAGVTTSPRGQPQRRYSEASPFQAP